MRGRIESAARDEQQGEAGADLLVVDADKASFVERHGGSPFSQRVAATLTHDQALAHLRVVAGARRCAPTPSFR
jgi:hypothetical protein